MPMTSYISRHCCLRNDFSLNQVFRFFDRPMSRYGLYDCIFDYITVDYLGINLCLACKFSENDLPGM